MLETSPQASHIPNNSLDPMHWMGRIGTKGINGYEIWYKDLNEKDHLDEIRHSLKSNICEKNV